MANQEEGIPAPNPPPAQAQAAQAPQTQQVPWALPAPQVPQGQLFVQLVWSNFKAEFSGKPDEDTKAHLLHANDWTNTHHFIEDVKVQRFCLTLSGEARLWYQS